MIKFIPDSFDSVLYNSVVNHPLQSWEWGQARKSTGIKILRIGEFKGKKLSKAYLITIHRIPFTKFNIGYIPRSDLPSKEFLEYLKKIAKKINIVFIKIEPNEEKLKDKSHKLNQQSKNQKLVESKHPLFPSWTQILDLNKSEEELFKNLHSKTRYNIRVAEKKNIIIKEVTSEKGYTIFENLYFETINRQKYKGHNRLYHRKIWEALKNKTSHILIAYYQDIPLAAYHLFIFKNRGYYVYGGSSDKYRNFMASNLLMWESLLFAKKNGCVDFDMWGSLPKDYSHSNPWAGFTRFKEGYGGKFIEMMGSFDLILNLTIYNLYNIAFKLRDFILKF